ncbi:MAG: biopolymer transporter ExbD [Deltaproteobacteria bacterium]|nr:biopolymer transporter ExbD [Deltaproteobacteria bacterium]
MRTIVILVALGVLVLAGCEEDRTQKLIEAASARVSAEAPPPVAPAKPAGMPEIVIDDLGAYIGGQRANPVDGPGRTKLKSIVKDLPIGGKSVELAAKPKAKLATVAAVLEELGRAGAPQIWVKTEGRTDLPRRIPLVPQSRIDKPSPCTLVASVLDDLSTATWPFAGGGGQHMRKGFAGPDLTQTGDAVTKHLRGCKSGTAFFSAGKDTIWELAFNLAATIVQADEDKKIDKLVLLGEQPVAGRPVELRE